MPRRNERVAIKRHRRPRAQAQRADYVPVQKHVIPVDIARMVVPTGKCGSKLIFGTKEDAKVALAQAQQRRKRFNNQDQEKRYYSCDRCEGFHLTSRETWQERKSV